MKKLKILPLFLLICLLTSIFLPLGATALEPPEINSNVVMVINRDTGEVFYSKNDDWKIYPASITKIMTVLLAVEAVERGEISLYDMVTADSTMSYDLLEDGSSAGIIVGETMSLENLLYCAMVSSANEACNIIARHIGGSIDNFIEMMNARAAELGCADTNFTNTHGLPDENHYTTARDFAIISETAANSETFMQIANTSTITIPATNLSAPRVLNNSNALICSDSIYGSGYIYEHAIGIKTGFTSAAGYCLVSSAIQNDINLLALVFDGKSYTVDGRNVIDSFKDSITLFDWVFDNYSYQEILKPTDTITSIDVALGSNADSVSLRSTGSITALLPNDYNPADFTRTITIYSELDAEELRAPIAAGEVLGEMSISRDGVNYGTVSLVAASSVDLSYSLYMKQMVSATLRSPIVIAIIVIVLLLLLAYIFLVVRYRLQYTKHAKARKLKQAQETGVAEKSPVRRSIFEKFKKNKALPPLDDDFETEVYSSAPHTELEIEPEAESELEIAFEPEPFETTTPEPLDVAPDIFEEDEADETSFSPPLTNNASRHLEETLARAFGTSLPSNPSSPDAPTPSDSTDETLYRDYFEEFFRNK